MMFKIDNTTVFKRSGFFLILHGLLLLLLLSAIPVMAQEKLLVFAGAASKPPTEEVAAQYEKKTGVKVDLVFGGSGYVLAQMKLSKQGDIYFPGSSDYMEIAKRDGNVFADTEKIIVYLVPAINVQKGNPHNIKKLIDLTKPGINVAIANPEGVCLGVYAVEIIEKEFTADEKEAFKNNLMTIPVVVKTATAISLKQADAVIGWGVLEHWDPERIETIKLDQKQIPRVGYIPIAIAKCTTNKKAAEDFYKFFGL